ALDADFALAFYNRGLAWERLGDPAAAASDYKRALALDPMVELVRQGLERARAQGGRVRDHPNCITLRGKKASRLKPQFRAVPRCRVRFTKDLSVTAGP